jgi:hypothetical protein
VGAALTESLGRSRQGARLDRSLGFRLDAVSSCAGSGCDDLVELGPDEVERGVVVRSVAGRKALPDQGTVRGPAKFLAVVVGTEASRQERQAVVERIQSRAERIRDAALEPAVGTGARPSEDGAALPRLPQRDVDAVNAPDRNGVRGVSTADVDHVLRRQMSHGVVGHAEEPKAAGFAVPAGEGLEERRDAPVGVSRRGGQQADARTLGGRERKEEVVEGRARVRVETAAAHRNDVPAHAAECREASSGRFFNMGRRFTRKRHPRGWIAPDDEGVAAAPHLFDDPPISSPELALVDAVLAAQLRADLTSGETFRPRPATRPEYPGLAFDAVVLDLAEAGLAVDEDSELPVDEADELSDDAVAIADSDLVHDATDEHDSSEALAPPVLEALPALEEHTFELPDYVVVSDDQVADAIPDYIVLPEEAFLPGLAEDIAPVAHERVAEIVPDPVLPDYVVVPEEVAATVLDDAEPAYDETAVEDVPEALPEHIVRDDESGTEVAVQASAEEMRSTSDYPMLPDLDERSDALEETEAALRRIREHMGTPAAPSGRRKRRFRRRFTVFAGLLAVGSLTALAAEIQLGLVHAPGFLAF